MKLEEDNAEASTDLGHVSPGPHPSAPQQPDQMDDFCKLVGKNAAWHLLHIHRGSIHTCFLARVGLRLLGRVGYGVWRQMLLLLMAFHASLLQTGLLLWGRKVATRLDMAEIHSDLLCIILLQPREVPLEVSALEDFSWSTGLPSIAAR